METKIKELITATPIKVQVSLDEDSTDVEVLSQLDVALRGLAQHEADGQKLKWTVGQILIMVRDRRLWADGHDTFESWLQTKVLEKYKLKRSTVLEAVPVLDEIPDAPKRKVPFTNLALIARAVKATPEGRREKVREQLLSEARQPIAEFRANLERRYPIRRRNRGMATIVIQVPAALAKAWRDYVGSRSGADVLSDLIGFTPGRKGAGTARHRVA